MTTSHSGLFFVHVGQVCPHVSMRIIQDYNNFISCYNRPDNITTLNEFWRFKCSTLTINTIEILSNIRDSDNLSFDEWLAMFNVVILPHITEFYPIYNIG